MKPSQPVMKATQICTAGKARGSHAILIDFFRVLLSRPPSITGRTNRWSPGCQFYASNWGPSQYRFRFGNRAILTGTAQIRLLVSSIISNINFLSQNSVYQLIIFFLLTPPPSLPYVCDSMAMADGPMACSNAWDLQAELWWESMKIMTSSSHILGI